MFANDLAPETTGVSVPHISPSQIAAFSFPLAPLEEQVEIATYVAGFEIKSQDLVGKARSAIELLNERRSALISAAVTGKIDVRNLAPAEAA
jgi:type I restriction enzyme S subunit